MSIAPRRQRLRKWITAVRARLARPEVRILARVLAIAVVALVALKSKSLFGRLGNVGHPDAGWLGVAVTVEFASLVAYALMVRELLRLGGVTARAPSLLRPTLAGIAMGASLPAGVGASNVYWYKQLRRHGADRGLSVLVMTGTSVAGAISLLGLLAIGIALAGHTGPLGDAYAWLVCVAAAVLVLRVAFAHRLGRMLTSALRRIAPRSSRATTFACAACGWS
jgi:hypothetical protein